MPKHPDYLHPYHQAVQRHGPSFQATLWASRDSQQTRFRVIADTLDLAGRSIIDAGCATADLAAYLHDNAIPYARYIGLDAVPELLTEARARDLPHTEFINADFVSDPTAFKNITDSEGVSGGGGGGDVIVFSGSLNTLEQKDAIAVLERAWPAARHALLFNFLSSRNELPPIRDDLLETKVASGARASSGDGASGGRASRGGAGGAGGGGGRGGGGGEDPARRFDPLVMLDWALNKTPDVLFRQDYLRGHDATIAMLR